MLRIVAVRDQELLTELKVADLPGLLADRSVHVWVDIWGPLDDQAREVTADIFRFHPLAIEDCFEERERPKIEAYDNHVYVITHGLTCGSHAEDTQVVELDAFLGRRYLVTYHSKESRSVETCWEMVLRSVEVLRRGPAALLQAILDRQVDGIEPVLETIEDRIGALESRVMLHARQADLVSLMALRRTILHLRRWLSLQRDVVLRLARAEFDLVTAQEALLFRDTHDHLSRFTEWVETYRELTTSLQESYLSVTNNRLSETMKFLTVFTAVLMPLTVLTGIYGMNFDSMPGLHNPYGFSIFALVMLLTVASALVFVRRKGWIGVENGDRAASGTDVPTDSPKKPEA
jgi:magnesium transporter